MAKSVTKRKTLSLRLPPTVAHDIDRFEAGYETTLSTNEAIVVLIKRGLAVSPEMERRPVCCAKCGEEVAARIREGMVKG